MSPILRGEQSISLRKDVVEKVTRKTSKSTFKGQDPVLWEGYATAANSWQTNRAFRLL